ncbi:hypothetical protein EDD39_0891 [Kitasatospora cineracea]|uniref:Cell wall-associated NlpC family hydrolase n=2 Tax=Kitasatospora cineracea TaxID=88074 RepID=A0A8G1UF19_9ACTN|nr:hypothetical protein EDD39_0891 [Kitasatospora cineracea]
MSVRKRRTVAAVAALVSAGLASAVLVTLPAHADTVVSGSQSVTSTGTLGNGAAPGGTVSRSQAVQRAQDWVDRAVPYSPNGLNSPYGWWADSATGGRYREDCSGLVSMAWQLTGSLTTYSLPSVSTRLGSLDDLKPGDAINSTSHVVLFASWTDSSHTSANVYTESGTAYPTRYTRYSRSYLESSGYYGLRYNKIVDSSAPQGYPDPASLPTGTLVKSPNNPMVKLIINGAGLAVAGSDVTPDGYDLSKVVTVDDAKFWALPSSLPSGAVVHDQGGGANRYAMVGGAALHISAAEWTANGYNTRADMGVPTSWLQQALQASLPAGTVVADEAGADPNRYVMIGGAALHISAAEWTADGYNNQPLVGVPGSWLQDAATKTPPSGTVLMDQSGADPNRYVTAGGTAAHITAAEWTADGYDGQALMGVPGSWLAAAVAAAPADGTLVKGQAGTDPNVYVMVNGSALLLTGAEFDAYYASRQPAGVPESWEAGVVARRLKDGTVVKNVSGADPSVYVMAGGMAVPLTAADFTGLGYDQQPLRAVPGTWEAAAAAKAAPADGTLLRSPDSATVWRVTAGSKKAAAAGSYNAADVVAVPNALTAKLPTVTG